MTSVSKGDLARGAAMLVGTSLRVRDNERLVVVADEDSLAIATAIADAGERAGASTLVARLDQLRSISTNDTGERPHKLLPDAVHKAMEAAQCSVFVASAPHAELGMREELLHLVATAGVRHAHMPGISPGGFAAGMAVDYAQLETSGRAMDRRMEAAAVVEVQSAGGSRLRCTFRPPARWWEHFGTITPGQWSTLPAGALYAQPESVDGLFVADASVGEFFGARAGVLGENGVQFFIEGGRVTKVDAPRSPALAGEISSMLAFAPGSDRVSVVVLGINAGLRSPTGEAAIDENLPGLHLVVGDPAGRLRVSAVNARTSFLVCGAGGCVAADGEPVIRDGNVVSET